MFGAVLGVKGNLCGQQAGFKLHAGTKVAANDEQGRLALCKYILRPPLANDRLKIIDDEHVRLDFEAPEPYPARPPPPELGGEGGGWLN